MLRRLQPSSRHSFHFLLASLSFATFYALIVILLPLLVARGRLLFMPTRLRSWSAELILQRGGYIMASSTNATEFIYTFSMAMRGYFLSFLFIYIIEILSEEG